MFVIYGVLRLQFGIHTLAETTSRSEKKSTPIYSSYALLCTTPSFFQDYMRYPFYSERALQRTCTCCLNNSLAMPDYMIESYSICYQYRKFQHGICLILTCSECLTRKLR